MAIHADISRGATSSSALAPAEVALELPADVAARAFDIADLDGVLATLSASTLAREVPTTFARKRRAEYLAGRHAAAQALRSLCLPETVGRGVDGLPLWPVGATGSIAHGAGVACALAARRDGYRSLGVDVERVLGQAECVALAPAIARKDELLLLRGALCHARSGQRLSVLFSCKESLFKCLYPLTRQFLEFVDVQLVSVGMSSLRQGLATLRLERDCGAGFTRGLTLPVRFALGERRTWSAALLEME
jgi:enterobactin synthetase component D